MASTTRNMWKVVYDRKCGAVVMLSDLLEDDTVSTDGVCVFKHIEIPEQKLQISSYSCLLKLLHKHTELLL